MLPLSYRSPKTEVRSSSIHGRGLFANENIGKGEVVLIKGGHIVDRATLRREITPSLGPVEIQIDDNFFITPTTADERELSMLYSNHSCDTNLGMRGEITFVAMRDIGAGEELTHDWCTTDDDDYEVKCQCASPNCRGMVTGKDWQKPELQQKYAGYFSPYLAEKIANTPGAKHDQSSR
jgi:SET domain-containing protein